MEVVVLFMNISNNMSLSRKYFNPMSTGGGTDWYPLWKNWFLFHWVDHQTFYYLVWDPILMEIKAIFDILDTKYSPCYVRKLRKWLRNLGAKFGVRPPVLIGLRKARRLGSELKAIQILQILEKSFKYPMEGWLYNIKLITCIF